MNLYKILITHAAPKGYETAIKEYVIAQDEKQLFEYLKKGYTYWEDCKDDEYEDKSKLEWIFEHKGDVDCDDKWTDLYYGSTMYSWNLVKEELDLEEVKVLSNLNVAVCL